MNKKIMDGEQLILTIANEKEKNREEAVKAFTLFCGQYEVRVLQMAVVLCNKWKKPEGCADIIVQCAFQKVWLYPSFRKSKSKMKDTDRAILNWLFWILIHELTLLSQKGDCSHPEPDDLPLITSSAEFVGEYFKDEFVSEEDFERMKKELDRQLSRLTEQEITIFLTYRVYLKLGKTVPRSVLKKLRARYNISQDGIKHCHLRVEQKIGVTS